jgi:cellulose synthase/poly-beta-1,6-N-acetylglucosamine synthase-like glycosyltransferase
MTVNEMVEWHSHLQTPVLFNHHEPYEVNATSINVVDLNAVASTIKAVENKERVLLLTPMRDAANYIPKYFDLLTELTYPHDLIDLAFLVGDCRDETLAVLSSELNRVQRLPEVAFHSATIVQKDFGATVAMDVEDKHKYKEQGPRRKAMAKARNFLLSAALKPEHSWVYWRDVDITDSPSKIIEDFVAHNKDILVPSMFLELLLLN